MKSATVIPLHAHRVRCVACHRIFRAPTPEAAVDAFTAHIDTCKGNP